MPAARDDLTALALSARDGDRVALAAFVRASQAEVWRLCAHLTDRDAADVYARTWLLSIAHRSCADHVRHV